MNIPGNQGVQAWDRYAYVSNNPVFYTDPSGQFIEVAFDLLSLAMTINDIRNEGFTVMNTISLVTDVAAVVLPIVPAGVSHAMRAAKTAAKLANTADAVGDTIKTVDKATDAARTLYHATDVNGAKSLLEKGIDLTKGRLNLDFNPAGQAGFYVTESLEQARKWASKFGDDGRIVQFNVAKKKLDDLSGKYFSKGDDEWLDFVTAGRGRRLKHAFDFVEGPMLSLKTNRPFGHQLAIFGSVQDRK